MAWEALANHLLRKKAQCPSRIRDNNRDLLTSLSKHQETRHKHNLLRDLLQSVDHQVLCMVSVVEMMEAVIWTI